MSLAESSPSAADQASIGCCPIPSGCFPSGTLRWRTAAGRGSSLTPRPTVPSSIAKAIRSAPATCAACATATGCALARTRSRCGWSKTRHARVPQRAAARSPIPRSRPIRSRWTRSGRPSRSKIRSTNRIIRACAFRPRSAQLPHDFDPLAPEAHETPFRGPTQADNSPVMQDAFRPPAQIGQAPLHSGGMIPGDDLLPDDWDKDLLEGISPSGGTSDRAPRAASAARRARIAPDCRTSLRLAAPVAEPLCCA